MLYHTIRRALALLTLTTLSSVAPATAQTITSGGTFGLAERPSGFNSTAYDSVNHVYLMTVAGSPTAGRFYDKNGTQIGNRFNIGSTADGAFLGWSGVTFGGPANDPVFLVTYTTQDNGNVNAGHTKYARLVRYNGGAPTVGPAVTITAVGGEWAFSEKAQAAWNGSAFVIGTRLSNGQYPQPWVHLFQVNANGGAVVAAQSLGDNQDFYGSPAVACIVGGTCIVSGFAAGIPFGYTGGSYARLFDGTTLAPVTGMFSVGDHAARQEGQQVVYLQHTGQFLTAYTEFASVVTRTISPTGALGTLNEPALGAPFAGWAGDLSLGYNPATRSSLLGCKANTGPVFGLFVLTLGDTGLPQTGQYLLIQSWDGKWQEFDPTVVPNAADAQWFVPVVELSAAAAVITGTKAQSPPIVTTNPSSLAAKSGVTVSFTSSATGLPAPTVQWERSTDGGVTWNPIPGYTSTTLSFLALPTNNNQRFRAHFSNGVSPDALSTAAVLEVRTAPPSDFSGNSKADVVIWNATTGTWHWSTAAGASVGLGATGVQFGNPALGDVAFVGDIDGDDIADLVIWRSSTGTWYWLTSSTGFAYASVGSKQWGNLALGDRPMLADFDGDGRADLGIWRASTGTWYWLTSSSGYSYAGAQQVQWGNALLGDRPFAADFDGDGKADLAVWRASNGTWYWLLSSSGYSYANAGNRQWGNKALGDVPLLGDIDGDGVADLVVWRSSTGTWYWLTSGSGYTSSGIVQWGQQALGDTPLMTDFDGDGHADLVIYRSSTGGWYWLSSSSNFHNAYLTMLGTSGDIPILK